MMISYFADRVKKFEKLRDKALIREKRLGLARIALSITALLLIIFFWNSSTILIYLIIVMYLTIFILLVYRHSFAKSKRRKYENYVHINLQEIKRLRHDFIGIDEGIRFVDYNHRCSSDLDFFGQGSLFQLLTRNETEWGKKKLADWMLFQDSSTDEFIEARQQAVQELAPKIEWRQKLQINNVENKIDTGNVENFVQWAKTPCYGYPKVALITYAVISPFCLISFTILFLVFNNYLLLTATTFVFMCNIIYLDKLRVSLDSTILAFRQNLPILQAYAEVVDTITDEKFSSDLLIHHQRQLGKGSAKQAVTGIARIGWMLDLMGQRGLSYEPIYKNFFYVLANYVFLLDTYLLIVADIWKKKNGNKVTGWFKTIGEIEAVSSLSSFAFANPKFNFPEINSNPCQIQAINISHPLVSAEDRVYNTFNFDKRISIVTGSNMAGKSTFLRTIGINATLAYMGAPVCSQYLSIPRLKVFTSMRTSDSLNKNVSTFGAELKRIESLLSTARSNKSHPLFFLIDEVFKGTNTYDRQIGTYSIIHNLAELNTFGIIATHDTEVGEYFNNTLDIKNYHFSSKILGNKLFFDYILKEGICKETNASQLMESIGLKIFFPEANKA